MKNSATDAAARELIDGIEGDYAVCMGVSEQSYRQFCDSGALGRMPNDTWAVHCHARKAQIDQLRALLAKSAAYEALVAEIEAAPVGAYHCDYFGQCVAIGIVTEKFDGDDATFRRWNWSELEEGQRVRLLLVREGGDGK